MANISKLLRIIEKLKKEEGALFERYPDEKSIDKVIDEFTTITNGTSFFLKSSS